MGDFTIEIEGSGNDGCARDTAEGNKIIRCGLPGCMDCAVVSAVNSLVYRFGPQISKAVLVHDDGPTDDLLTGVRKGSFKEPVKAVVPKTPAPVAPQSVVASPPKNTGGLGDVADKGPVAPKGK
jgi:hypothetical protein